jgi:hypothetical protein
MKRIRSVIAGIVAGMLTALPSASDATVCEVCAACDAPHAEDAVVCGCSIVGPGELGIDALAGDVNQTIAVPITISTDSIVDSFTIDLLFPNTLVDYVSITKIGTLVSDWAFVSGNENPTGTGVRVSGFGGAAEIPSGVTGDLVIVNFRVSGSGCDKFCFFRVQDSVESYLVCPSGYTVSAPGTDLVSAPWGIIKAGYR